MEIFVCSTLAADIKFNTHVLWTLRFEIVKNKNLCLSPRVWKTIFFSRTVLRSAREPTQRSTWRVIIHAKSVRSYVHNCFMHFIQFWTFLKNFWFLWKEKKSFSIFPNPSTKIFFYKIKAESSLHIFVKFYFSRVCRTHTNFQLLIKISFFSKFFVFFGSLKTRDIFLTSMKLSLNHN